MQAKRQVVEPSGGRGQNRRREGRELARKGENGVRIVAADEKCCCRFGEK